MVSAPSSWTPVRRTLSLLPEITLLKLLTQNSSRLLEVSKNYVSYYLIQYHCVCNVIAGKWTTYRSMAKDTMDKVVQVAGLEDSKGCQTDGYMLEGGGGWYPTLFIRLVQDYGLDIDVRKCSMFADLAHLTTVTYCR